MFAVVSSGFCWRLSARRGIGKSCTVVFYVNFNVIKFKFWAIWIKITLNKGFFYYYSWFACDVIAAILVYSNDAAVITFFCCIHQHGRNTLCHLNPW